jgi:hypothetical protein
VRSAAIAAVAAACLVAAGVTLALALRQHDARAASRVAARAALLDRRLPTGSLRFSGEQGDLKLRYWRSLAVFEQALAPQPLSRTARLRLLARAASVLTAEAAGKPSADRSRALTLLGLVSFARASLQAPGSEARHSGAREAVGAFRAAVLADNGNDDAKTDLELLLQSTRSSRAAPKAGRGKTTKQRRAPAPVGVPSGGGSAAPNSPVGY